MRDWTRQAAHVDAFARLQSERPELSPKLKSLTDQVDHDRRTCEPRDGSRCASRYVGPLEAKLIHFQKRRYGSSSFVRSRSSLFSASSADAAPCPERPRRRTAVSFAGAVGLLGLGGCWFSIAVGLLAAMVR